jgi:hypothetical protein
MTDPCMSCGGDRDKYPRSACQQRANHPPRSYETPAAERAAALFDADTRGLDWRSVNPHTSANLRFAVRRAAGGEAGVLEEIVEYYYKPGQRAGVLEHLQRLVRSAQEEPKPC